LLPSIGRDWGRGVVRCRGIWVDSSSFIGHISNIASIAISLVSNMLGTAIRKGNRVRSLSITSTITSLGSVEVGVRVVISNSVCVGVRGGLIGVGRFSVVSWGSVDHRGMVGRGSMNNRGSVVSRGVVDHRGVVGRGVVDHRGSVVDRGGMVSRSVSKHSLGSMETVRRVSNSSNGSTKSLGLDSAPVLSLVGLGHRLVGHLASRAAMVPSYHNLASSTSNKHRQTHKHLRGKQL
jgi:hypothetical protein